MFPDQWLWPVTCHGGLANAASGPGPPRHTSGWAGHADGPPRVWVKTSPACWAALRSPLLPAPPHHKGDASPSSLLPGPPSWSGLLGLGAGPRGPHGLCQLWEEVEGWLLVTRVMALALPPHACARTRAHTTQVCERGPCPAGSLRAFPEQGPRTQAWAHPDTVAGSWLHSGPAVTSPLAAAQASYTQARTLGGSCSRSFWPDSPSLLCAAPPPSPLCSPTCL